MTSLKVTASDLPASSHALGRSLLGGGAALAVAVALASYGWHWWTVGRFIESTNDAYVGGEITVISPKVPGYITSVVVSDNQLVHAGDLLLKLDDRDYRAALARAEAAVAAQQALLANLDATRHLQQAVIAQARAGVAASQAETTRASDDQRRYSRLVGSSAVSVESAQRVAAEYQQALANSSKAEAGLQAAGDEVSVIDTRRQQAQAALAQAIAERDLARLDLSYTELRAPIDGVVGNRHARLGAYAAAASQQLSLVPVQGLWVDANFKESQLAAFHPGQPVLIRADVLPGHEFHGHVLSLAPATGAQFSVLPPENATGNFTRIVQRVPVRIALDDADSSLLRAGLSVDAYVDARPATSAQVASRDSVVRP